MSFAIWLTGLPASGKSAIARELAALMHSRGVASAVLESDVMRTQLTPFSSYDRPERDFFYAALVQLGAHVVEQGRPVIFDATANLRAYRDAARARITRFAEVFVDTPLEVCRARDPKELYKKAGNLPGVQAPYEAPPNPELAVRGDQGTPAEAAAKIAAWLEERSWL